MPEPSKIPQAWAADGDYNVIPTTNTVNNTGNGQAHNNMPPYLAVNMWRRTA